MFWFLCPASLAFCPFYVCDPCFGFPPSLSLSLSLSHSLRFILPCCWVFLVCFLSSPSPHPTLFCLEGWGNFFFFFFIQCCLFHSYFYYCLIIYFFLLHPPPRSFFFLLFFFSPPPPPPPQCVSLMVSVFSVHLCCCLLSCLSCQFLCDVSVMFVMPVSL